MRLLEADGSLIQACDREGATPLHLRGARKAKRRWWHGCSLDGANVQKQDRHGRTPLDRAALAADPRNDGAQLFPAIARRLLERGAEVTITAPSRWATRSAFANWSRPTPPLAPDQPNGGLLTLAVNHGQIEIVRLLLDLGADVDERIVLRGNRGAYA